MRGGCLIAAVAAALFAAGCSREQAPAYSRATPVDSVRAMLNAIAQRDADQFRASYSKQADAAYVEAMAALLKASVELEKAATEKFNRDLARDLSGSAGAGAEDLRLLDEAVVETEGSTAVVRFHRPGGGERRLRLVREEGQWLLVGDDSADADTFAAAARRLRDLAEAMAQAAADLRADRFKGREARDVRTELRGRFVGLLMADRKQAQVGTSLGADWAEGRRISR